MIEVNQQIIASRRNNASQVNINGVSFEVDNKIVHVNTPKGYKVIVNGKKVE